MFLDVNIDEVPSVELLEAGEHEFQIKSAEPHYKKDAPAGTGNSPSSIRIILRPVQNANAEDIFFYLGLPKPEDDERPATFKRRQIAEFCEAFQCSNPPGGLDTSGWTGCSGFAITDIEDDPNYGKRNVIKRVSRPSA